MNRELNPQHAEVAREAIKRIRDHIGRLALNASEGLGEPNIYIEDDKEERQE